MGKISAILGAAAAAIAMSINVAIPAHSQPAAPPEDAGSTPPPCTIPIWSEETLTWSMDQWQRAEKVVESAASAAGHTVDLYYAGAVPTAALTFAAPRSIVSFTTPGVVIVDAAAWPMTGAPDASAAWASVQPDPRGAFIALRPDRIRTSGLPTWAVLAHEIGHAAFGMRHNAGGIMNGLMTPRNIDGFRTDTWPTRDTWNAMCHRGNLPPTTPTPAPSAEIAAVTTAPTAPPTPGGAHRGCGCCRPRATCTPTSSRDDVR